MFGFGKKDPKEMANSVMLIISSLEKDLVVELGLGELSDDKGKEILNQTTEMFLKKIILRGVEKLDAKSRSELAELAGDRAIPFLCSKVSNFDKLVKEESAGFKKEMVSLAQTLK